MDTGWTYVRKQFLYILFIFLLCLLFLIVGLLIGYALIGDGKDPLAILSPSKWQLFIEKFTGQ